MAGLIKYLELSNILNNPYDFDKIISPNIPKLKEININHFTNYNKLHPIKQHQKVNHDVILNIPLTFTYSIHLS